MNTSGPVVHSDSERGVLACVGQIKRLEGMFDDKIKTILDDESELVYTILAGGSELASASGVQYAKSK